MVVHRMEVVVEDVAEDEIEEVTYPVVVGRSGHQSGKEGSARGRDGSPYPWYPSDTS